MMMGFSVLFIFALIHISTLYAGGNSEDLSNTDSSNPRHRLHPRGRFRRDKAVKEKEQGPAGLDTYLKFVVSKDPPEHAVLVSLYNDDYYILRIGNCSEVTLKALKSSEKSPYVNEEECRFLVNQDNFEILEWKKWADIKQGQIPFNPVMICKSHFIAKYNNTFRSLTRDSLKNSDEVLVLNYDIKGQDFQRDNCEDKKRVKPDKTEVIKVFTADNKNCNPAKHVVKFDQGSDRTRSSLKSSTHTVGGSVEASASVSFYKIFELSTKLTAKYDYTHLNSETTSNVDKDLHSVTTEVEIPPNHSCTIEILSRTSTVQYLCSGQLFRQYKNGEEHTTFITGIYYQEEKADLLTSMNRCTPMTYGAKCCNA